jgi:hypothetical protein
VGAFSRYSWIFLLIGAGIILWRLWAIWKRIRAAGKGDDWDTKLVRELRARGMDPFTEHPVDFFMGLPDEAACTAVNQQLERQGFRVDIKAVPESVAYPFSLHASKKVRVNVDDMHEHSRRFTALAKENRGRYDGWSGK